MQQEQLFAFMNGTIQVSASIFSGFGTPMRGTSWSKNCATYSSYGSNIRIKLVMVSIEQNTTAFSK
jgi:hypothetical protein